jgi:hypothetical protein
MILDRVTITGADDSVSPVSLFPLTKMFPYVEWGILLSRLSESRPRFPSMAWLERLVALEGRLATQLPLCGHLCGSWVRDLLRGVPSFFHERPQLGGAFQRMQINTHAQALDIVEHRFTAALREYSPREGYIFQMDGVNMAPFEKAQIASCNWPESIAFKVYPLFDLSGGAGILPDAWPAPISSYCGYAGGLSPTNVVEQLQAIEAKVPETQRVWIDVETHVRTDDNSRLDLDKVFEFLKACEPFVATPIVP